MNDLPSLEPQHTLCPLYHLQVQDSKGEGNLIVGTDGIGFGKELGGGLVAGDDVRRDLQKST